MPKQKTRKAVAKRFQTTAKKKVVRRNANQNHFNGKESGNVTRGKRTDVQIEGKMAENIKRELNLK